MQINEYSLQITSILLYALQTYNTYDVPHHRDTNTRWQLYNIWNILGATLGVVPRSIYTAV